MSITVLTRFRKQGPGFPVVTGQLGVLEQWAWWYPYNKLGNTYINGRQTLGSKQVTWDNVHPFFATGRKAFVSSPRRVNPPKEPKVPWVHTPYKGKHPKAPKPPKVQVKRVKELKMKPLRKRWDFVAPSDIGGDFTSVILCDNSALQGVLCTTTLEYLEQLIATSILEDLYLHGLQRLSLVLRQICRMLELVGNLLLVSVKGHRTVPRRGENSRRSWLRQIWGNSLERSAKRFRC